MPNFVFISIFSKLQVSAAGAESDLVYSTSQFINSYFVERKKIVEIVHLYLVEPIVPFCLEGIEAR